ncbi:DNA/RNA non-specific endonuclease [Pollutimonas harenae]|uniref:DNA/RNA non-specific endonuclease n=1 Tax=Pollutimonas harenae TaxID=657015 RepID=A0A853H9Y2_9BURK|nr:DNA/RNA non-specific endonuclease [Pollutimonas harenae]NYT86834.1 DNA/RNA non-specific endonuclease [Pollutimonas harenae]TEA71571.1 DNA/RNA non-specific endonuclease [Pollutimonas harenae]
MASKKKSVVRKRRSSSKKVQTSRFKRFFRALAVSAVTSFGAASCVLNPQLREQIPLEPMLSQLGLPGHEQIAPQVVATGPQVQTNFAQCRQFFPNGRPPIVPAGRALRELCFSSFAILHSGETKTPVFVVQRLNRRMLLQGKGIERTDRFYPEARLPSAERAELDDYRGSGYARGHMAPAGDMHTSDAMAQSFSLANMVPQDQRQNSGPWSTIEQDTRKYILRARGDVYVFTGPVYTARSEAVGAGRVAVPTYLYKVVYDATTGRSWVHWQANSPAAKVGPPISYEEFVRRTGKNLLNIR